MKNNFAKRGYILNFVRVDGDETGWAYVYTLKRRGIECLCETRAIEPSEAVFDEMIAKYERQFEKEEAK